jgi:hypothetical protein
VIPSPQAARSKTRAVARHRSMLGDRLRSGPE